MSHDDIGLGHVVLFHIKDTRAWNLAESHLDGRRVLPPGPGAERLLHKSKNLVAVEVAHQPQNHAVGVEVRTIPVHHVIAGDVGDGGVGLAAGVG